MLLSYDNHMSQARVIFWAIRPYPLDTISRSQPGAESQDQNKLGMRVNRQPVGFLAKTPGFAI